MFPNKKVWVGGTIMPRHISVYVQPLEGESREACKARLIREAASTLDCGFNFSVIDWTKLPLVDVPCPCGDPSHWLVKWGGSETDTTSGMEVPKIPQETLDRLIDQNRIMK